MAALRQHFTKSEVHLEMMNFSREPDLRFLRDALQWWLEPVQTEKKLVLLIQGLEVAMAP